MSNKQLILCPDCSAEITINDDSQIGEVVTCPDCSIDLEIIKMKPIEVKHAPMVQEDWGQ